MMLFVRGHSLVATYFESNASARSSRRMWKHLRHCTRCRKAYEAHAFLEAREAEGEAIERARVQNLLFPKPKRSVPFVLGGIALAIASTFAVVLTVLPARNEPFRTKGGAGIKAAATPDVFVYRVTSEGKAVRAGSIVSSSEALALSYVNPEPAPFRYLMVFAADHRGRVFWFVPAWDSPEATPTSLPIVAASKPVDLKQAVRHNLSAGPLAITAFFSRIPYDVRAMEAIVRQPGGLHGAMERGDVAGYAAEQMLEVAP